jgi:hypothetical protein
MHSEENMKIAKEMQNTNRNFTQVTNSYSPILQILISNRESFQQQQDIKRFRYFIKCRSISVYFIRVGLKWHVDDRLFAFTLL